MKVTFDRSEDIAGGITTFWFKPEQRVRYLAGQFTELTLPHEGMDIRGPKRWFTLSSSPTEPLIAITTKFASQEGSTFKRELAALKPGAQLDLADPMGDFVLPKDPALPLIFVAGGMGITPVRSMVKYLVDTGEHRDVRLIYNAPRETELAFLTLLTSYVVNYTTIVSHPVDEYTGPTGRLTTSRLLELAPDDGKSLYYVSGPESMVETFYKELKAKGIEENRLVMDYYPGYTRF